MSAIMTLRRRRFYAAFGAERVRLSMKPEREWLCSGVSARSLHGATAIVTWSVVVTPPICISMDTASPVGVLWSGITPI